MEFTWLEEVLSTSGYDHEEDRQQLSPNAVKSPMAGSVGTPLVESTEMASRSSKEGGNTPSDIDEHLLHNSSASSANEVSLCSATSEAYYAKTLPPSSITKKPIGTIGYGQEPPSPPPRNGNSPDPGFILGLLDMMPEESAAPVVQKEEKMDERPPWGWFQNGDVSPPPPQGGLPSLETMKTQEENEFVSDPMTQELMHRVDEMYESIYNSWVVSVNQLEERFVTELPQCEVLLAQIQMLLMENHKLKNENFQIRSQSQAWQRLQRGGTTPLSSNGLTPLSPASLSSPTYMDSLPLLLQQDQVNIEDLDDEKAFESQIDRAKLKTKLCKYFMQSEQGTCPFFRRHGWCAFAHGEKELNTAAHPGAGSPMLPPTPPLVPSPLSMNENIPMALSPALLMEPMHY